MSETLSEETAAEPAFDDDDDPDDLDSWDDADDCDEPVEDDD